MPAVRKRAAKRKTGTAAKGAATRVGTSAVADGPARRTRNPQLAKVVEKALPGWELVESPVEQQSDEDRAMATDQEPSIAYLKRKFLGEQAADSTDDDILDVQDGRKPVRVRPKGGGKAKTADVSPDGKVTIVQG